MGAEAGRDAGVHAAAEAVDQADRSQARHKGEATWRELLVDDGRLTAEYVAAAPGTKVSRRFHPDTREWFAVVGGEMRVEIEGQAPIIATRGSLVNIPRQTIYAVETVGSRRACGSSSTWRAPRRSSSRRRRAPPAAAGRHRLDALDDQPQPGPLRRVQPAAPEHPRGGAKNEKYTGGRFVRDDKSEMLVLYGHEKNMPPLDPADKGHFHAESAEFWLVFTGQIRYAFEGQQPFIASEGDVVYVPANTWHATRFIGEEPSCRLVDHRVRRQHAGARTAATASRIP